MASIRRRRRRREAGFTLIEIMFVVVIIAILAALAIPVFTENTNKTKAKAEVTAFFAEISTREEQFKVDSPTNVYFPTAPGSSTACPPVATIGSQQQTLDCTAATKPWAPTALDTLNVKVPTVGAYCSYVITSGNTVVAAGSLVAGGITWVFSSAVAGVSWFHILATCDIDGDGTKSFYFTSSQSSDIQVNNEGE